MRFTRCALRLCIFGRLEYRRLRKLLLRQRGTRRIRKPFRFGLKFIVCCRFSLFILFRPRLQETSLNQREEERGISFLERIYKTIRRDDFLIEICCVFLLAILLPVGFGHKYLSGMFSGFPAAALKPAVLSVMLTYCFAAGIAVRIFHPKSEKSGRKKSRGELVKYLILSALNCFIGFVAVFVAALAIRDAVIDKFLNPKTILFILIWIALILIFINLICLLRAFIIRRRFFKSLKAVCYEMGYYLSEIKHP